MRELWVLKRSRDAQSHTKAEGVRLSDALVVSCQQLSILLWASSLCAHSVPRIRLRGRAHNLVQRYTPYLYFRVLGPDTQFELKMVQLCSNRREGFGPDSTISSPLTTSCFVDVVLIPLPVWLALLLVPILFGLSLHHRKQNFNPSTAYLRATPRRNWAFNGVSATYYVLIVCNILMLTLEIVRLELIHFGIGLIPFAYVGLLLSCALHWSEGARGRIRGWQTIAGIVWMGGLVMSAVQVAGLSKEGIHARKGSKYPISDQIIDVAVMAGVYAVVAILELVLGLWRALRRARGQRAESLQSGMSPVIETTELVAKYAPTV